MSTREYRFGDFTLRPSTRELLERGEAKRLGRRSFDLLQVLVERAGAVVPRDELFAQVWAGRVVSDDNLKVQVMTLRGLIGADAIVTAAGIGYRFALPVKTGSASETVLATPSDSLLGRSEELHRVSREVRRGVLVTVVGSGGVGKTRLAMEAARRLAAAFDDGVSVIEFAGLQEPGLVCGAVARQLKLPQASQQSVDALARAVAPLSLLLVLDNCEHLADAVRELAAAVLAEAPDVALLATSQEPLGIQGEVIIRLDGLSLPQSDASLDQLHQNPAASLLIERARHLDADVRVTPTDATAIAALCHGLDGIPLALEMAAARVPLLGWQGTRDRLDQQLQLLTRNRRDAPSRHQTLRAALQWSHALLAPREKEVFRRLGVFADAFSIEMAERIAGEPRPDALDALHALVDKSLVHRVPMPTGRPRLRLLVTAREFALERLADTGELDEVRRRQADAVAEFHERAQREALHEPMLVWLDRMWPEIADLRSILVWAAGPSGDSGRLLRLISAAGYFWNAAGLDSEARRWLTIARPLLDAKAPAPVAARYWAAAAHRVVDPVAPIGEALEAARRAADLFRELGDVEQEYRMLGIQAHHGRRVDPPLDVAGLLAQMKSLEQPDWSNNLRAVRRRCEGIALARSERWQEYRDCFAAEALQADEDGDELGRWGAQHHICLGDMALGEPRRGADGMRLVVDRLRALGYLRWQWTRPALHLMALIEADETPAATRALRETLPLLRVAGAINWVSESLGRWALLVGAPEEAARLLGWSDASRSVNGTLRRDFHAQQIATRLQSHVTSALGEARVDALRAEGRNWSDEVVAHRLAELLSRQAT